MGDAVNPWIGRVIGDRYRVEKRIGDGSSGTVYLAEHVTLNEKVAVRKPHPSLSQSPDFCNVLSAKPKQPPRCAIRMWWPRSILVRSQTGRYYLVLEYVEGTTLRDAIEAGMFDPLRATQCLRRNRDGP